MLTEHPIMMKTYFTLLLIVSVLNAVKGLRCYTCSMTEDDADDTCDKNPAEVNTGAAPITDCDKKYCTIVRIEYKDPKGKLQSLTRNCQDKILNPDQITEDETFRTYSRYCKTDLCNGGSGKGSEATKTYLGDKSLIMCPGTGNSAPISEASIISTVILSVFVIYYLD